MLYSALLKKIKLFIKKGKPMTPTMELTEPMKIYLAGKKSREINGAEIIIDRLSLSNTGFTVTRSKNNMRTATNK